MGKIKVKIDEPIPSKKVIHRHKNFNSFLENYQKYYSTRGIRHMLYNDRKKLVFIVLMIVFLLLLLFAND